MILVMQVQTQPEPQGDVISFVVGALIGILIVAAIVAGVLEFRVWRWEKEQRKRDQQLRQKLNRRIGERNS